MENTSKIDQFHFLLMIETYLDKKISKMFLDSDLLYKQLKEVVSIF